MRTRNRVARRDHMSHTVERCPCADACAHGGWRRDDVSHTGEKIDWGRWAITGNDPEFRGTGNPDTGDDYGPAPGEGPCLMVV